MKKSGYIDNNVEDIIRYNSNVTDGLSSEQVAKRKSQGLYNYNVTPKFKTTRQILVSNIFTYFNILNFVLAVCILAVGSFRNVFFIGVVICNVFIGILQELKVKKIIKKLSIVSQSEATVVRDGKETVINISEIVLDDIIILKPGDQISVDAVVKKGFIEVNESLITGESDLVLKKEEDKLISGSFVVSGSCIAKVENVGVKTYVSKILMDVGKYKKSKSEIMKYINTIVKVVAILIGPIAMLRFYKEYFVLQNPLQDSVVLTVASVIGMIPEGIVLLTSITLVMGVIRLSKLNVLTQDLFSLETLAKVDIICLDKTGTITEGSMEVDEIINVSKKYNNEDINTILWNFCENTKDKGSTIEGLKKVFLDENSNICKWNLESVVYFSSERKWSGINFINEGNFVLGAPEILLKDKISDYISIINKYAFEGKRILVMGVSANKLFIDVTPNIEPICFIVMLDKIRDSAIETLNFFKEQNVDIKIISGDNPISVSKIAKLVGLEGSEKYIDVSDLNTQNEIEKAVMKYNIFGRAKPAQKRQLIKAYQNMGHTVGMVGDGVNDILALKEADCSVAMAAGNDAVRQISKFVLLDSSFKFVPNIVNEGRRVVNNIIRAASMFLIKNIYSFVLSLILLFFATSYPFQPIQLTLLGALTIGIPSFFLALKKNKSPIKGDFLKNVLVNAIPPAAAIIVNIVFINVISKYLINFSLIQISTMAVILTGLCNLMALVKLSTPLNLKDKMLIIVFSLLFILSIMFFKNLFFLSSINLKMLIVMLFLGLYNYWQINICTHNMKYDKV